MIRHIGTIALSLAAMAGLMAAAPAKAQYYPPYGGGGGYEEERPYRGGGGYYGDRRRYDRDYYERRRPRYGSVCVTSRGNCDAGFSAPRNTPCRCFLPGFGEKRGAIGY